LDGKPRFNLNQFNEQYFTRLRARTMAARKGNLRIYQPQSGPFAVHLIAGTYAYEWFDAVSETPVANGVVTIKQGRSSFTPPFAGDAVLYLKSYQPKSIL
jgi:hypothetical protein